MSVKLKKLKDQVIVITGASSGIGLATAKLAAEKGAQVVLSSRNTKELKAIVSEIVSAGGSAISVRCDVAKPEDVEALAARAISEFGRIDSWINNAGVSIYGKLWETPLDEKRKLFDTNFWGVVHGCRSAVKVMKDSGGAIINIGSVLSDRAIPIQGVYSASKHAVKGYTDALRMEVEAENWPLSVSLVKPAAIDTPYIDHAKNHMKHHPNHTPPVYPPEAVAKAILDCAEHSQRDVFVGGGAKLFSLLETFLPRITDLYMENAMMEAGQSSAKLDSSRKQTALSRATSAEGEVNGTYEGPVFNSSAYTQAVQHPVVSVLVATGLGLAAAAGISYLQKRRQAALAPRDVGGAENYTAYVVEETFITH